jgi:hypothetical protein
MDTALTYTVEVLDKLRWNAHLGKHKHFEAGSRGKKYHVCCGVPIVLINIVLGSVMFTMLGERKEFLGWIAWFGAILSLVAAGLGGVQTFFNFEKHCIEHRAVANEYLSIARESERLLALHFDNLLSLEKLSEQIERLNDAYSKVNSRSEGLVVSGADYKRAMATQQKKKAEETSLVQRFTSGSLKK